MVKLNIRKSIFNYINKNNKLYNNGIFETWHQMMVLYLIL